MRSTLYVSASVAILLASLTAQTQGPRSTPDGIGQLVVQLSASDAESRAAAACALRQKARRAEAAIPALTRLLSDATAVPIVCAQFDSEVGVSGAPFRTSPGYEAGRALGAIGNAALESLLRSASDTNRDIRRNALRGLAAVRDVRGVGALVSATRDSDAFVRAEAALALRGHEGGEGIATALVRLTKDADLVVRARAVQSLATVDGSEAITALIAALSDPAASVRVQAASALGRRRERSGVPPLIGALNDRAIEVRERAVASLGALRDPVAVGPLVALLKDPDPDVRERTAVALGRIGDPRASAPLVEALRDGDAVVRERAAEALGRLQRGH